MWGTITTAQTNEKSGRTQIMPRIRRQKKLKMNLNMTENRQGKLRRTLKINRVIKINLLLSIERKDDQIDVSDHHIERKNGMNLPIKQNNQNSLKEPSQMRYTQANERTRI